MQWGVHEQRMTPQGGGWGALFAVVPDGASPRHAEESPQFLAAQFFAHGGCPFTQALWAERAIAARDGQRDTEGIAPIP